MDALSSIFEQDATSPSILSNFQDNSSFSGSLTQEETQNLKKPFDCQHFSLKDHMHDRSPQIPPELSPLSPLRPSFNVNSTSSMGSDDFLTGSNQESRSTNEDSLRQEDQIGDDPSVNRSQERQTSTNEVRPAEGNDLRWWFLNRQAFRGDWSADEAAETIMLKGFETYVYFIVIYFFGMLVVEDILSSSCLFSFNICIFTGQALRTLLFCRNDPTMTKKQKLAKYFKAVDWLLLGAFTAAGGYKFFEEPSFLLTPFAILGIVNILLASSYSSIKHSVLTNNTITHLYLVFWAQLLLVGLKVDGVLDSWNLVFISLFYLLIFCMTFSVGICVVAIPYLSESRRNAQDSDYPIAGFIWYILNGMHSWIWGFALLGLLERLNGQGGYYTLKYGCIAGIVHSLTVAGYVAFQCEKIFIHLTSTLESFFGQAEKWNENVLFESIKENIRYLLKVSPTYFMMVEKKMKAPSRKFSEESKKQIKQAKRKPKCNALSIKFAGNGNDFSELKSATIKARDNLFCSTPLVSSGMNDDDVCYSDNDGDILEEVQQNQQKDQCNNDETEEKSCVICCLNSPNAVFMSCGHGGVCHDCAIKTWKNSNNCVFCRQPINEILKVTMIKEVNIAKVTEGTRRSVMPTGEGYDWERWVS